MDRRIDELRGQRIVEAIETAVGKPLPETQRHDLMRGADELDLVRSGPRRHHAAGVQRDARGAFAPRRGA